MVATLELSLEEWDGLLGGPAGQWAWQTPAGKMALTSRAERRHRRAAGRWWAGGRGQIVKGLSIGAEGSACTWRVIASDKPS